MLGVVLFGVVGVDAVGHIRTDEETLSDGSIVITQLEIRRETLVDPLGDLSCHVAVSTLGRLGANFLMIEKH